MSANLPASNIHSTGFSFPLPTGAAESINVHSQHPLGMSYGHASEYAVPPPPLATPAPLKRQTLKSTILVADANPTELAQTIRILSRDDFNVFSAVCNASALSAAKKLEVDVIVCDLSLWMGATGKDLVAEIHEVPGRADVPIVFTSSGQRPDIIRRQHEFGGAYHLKKPFAPEVLLEFVERALWMPHLVNSHIQKPHFQSKPSRPAIPPGAGVLIDATEVTFHEQS